MKKNIEHMSDQYADRMVVLENRAAELEQRLLEATGPGALPLRGANAAEEGNAAPDHLSLGTAGNGFRGSDGRTEALINRGRQPARPPRIRWVRAHWRAAGLGTAVAVLGFAILALVLPRGASWPASVARVRAEITLACQNPNVAAEPSQLNFACARPTQSVLWVFSLLTSADNPAFADRATGRRGLEPIRPAQGGDLAYSLNLHHAYDPANPIDSLQVAARAINNIISGATVTSADGAPLVEPGLESKAANCLRYTGSARLAGRNGFPARCAQPVTAGAGQAALVSDAFRQWMGGAPSPAAARAGVLFENAGNPGNPRVQGILASLPR